MWYEPWGHVKLAERLGRPRTTVHKTLCSNRRLDPIEFLDWCEALEWTDPLAIIESVRETRQKR